jgi:hypothetical protein
MVLLPAPSGAVDMLCRHGQQTYPARPLERGQRVVALVARSGDSAMSEFVVFYAWQSDTLQRLNRHLIRAALNLAARSISADPAMRIKVRIDADTEGVLGHVPVTETILKKIAACDAFVPDLTFVASTATGKLVPNPNVMLEYGYALRAKSHSVMIPVMNAAYGPAEKLPFDMGHLRFPLQFNLPAMATNAQRRAVRSQLTEEFERILRQMIAAVPPRQSTALVEAPSVSPGFFFPSGTALAAFGFPGEQEYRFDGDSAIYLRLFPKYSDGQPKLTRTNLKALVVDRRRLNPMSLNHGGLSSVNDYGWIAIDPTANTLTNAITQVFPTGELWGINSQVFTAAAIRRNALSSQEPALAVGVISAEKVYTRTLQHYISVATEEIKFRPPFVVEIGAVGLKGAYMGAPHPEFPRGRYYGPIRESSLVRRFDLADTQDATVFGALRQFFEELYDIAECSRADVLTDEYVRKNDIPSRT